MRRQHGYVPIRASRAARCGWVAVILLLIVGGTLEAHIVPPEELHPVAESYRRLIFVLGLNPVPWDLVERDTQILARGLLEAAPDDAKSYATQLDRALRLRRGPNGENAILAPTKRREIAAQLFDVATRAVASAIRQRLVAAGASLDDHATASGRLEEARLIWAAFEPVIRESDPEGYRRLGECWLELSGALGSPGVLGRGAVPADAEVFARESEELVAFLDANYGEEFGLSRVGRLAPIPVRTAKVLDIPPLLPPGSRINKQLPRPRQILNMATRGVDETETTLIALGDMGFDSPFIFGEPARSLGISCNTCHNKSITNPGFFIPGLSARPGGMDVSNSFFAPHANNGHFDHIDTPDLRGIRFTAPYGRNGRFDSLREFVRNVIVNEFNGPEPSPLLLDGFIAYMLEFDFLPNPVLEPEGTLNEQAPAAARRGEEIFNRPFAGLGNRSCASCHIPSDHFVDRRRHDIGSAAGAEAHSRDKAFDTPTLLGVRYTAPYFHDGSIGALRGVNEWFNNRFQLGLTDAEITDLTAYVETVGEGIDAYEDTLHTLEAELEEFSFFLSAYEFLKQRNEPELIDQTLATVAFEIRAHKWDVQDQSHLPLLDRLAELVQSARAAYRAGDVAAADARIAEYRQLYHDNAEVLK